MFLDLASLIPYNNDKHWDPDGTHFSVFGYKKLAKFVFDVIEPWLSNKY